MEKEEVAELLDLKGWSTARLADEMKVKEVTVERWLRIDKFRPAGPAEVLMRIWLREARQEKSRPRKDMATAS
jgi:hypothetical protein